MNYLLENKYITMAKEIKKESKIDSIFKQHYKIAFSLTLIVSIIMLLAGFILPPMGKIDPSVCTAVGEMFCWPALAFGAKALQERNYLKSKAHKK